MDAMTSGRPDKPIKQRFHVTFEHKPPNLPTDLQFVDGFSEQTVTTDNGGIFAVMAIGPEARYWIKHKHFLAAGDRYIPNENQVIEVKLLAGDFNGDNKVDSSDFVILQGCNGKTPSDPGYRPECDLNGDNKINEDDFALFQQNFGKGGAPKPPLPTQPSSSQPVVSG